MKRVVRIALILGILLTATDCPAFVHVARRDETLSELALFYYGDRTKSMMIRAANGFMHPDDGSLLPGERIEIPSLTYHVVSDGEDWYSLADRYLGTSKRAPFLAEINERTLEVNPVPETIVKIPYQLLYIFAPNETLKSVTRLFLGTRYPQDWLRDYNLRGRRRFGRGDAILIPLVDIDFTENAKKRIETLTPRSASSDEKESQIEAAGEIAALRTFYHQGEYLQIVVHGQILLNSRPLTNPQRIGVYTYLAFAYVAFNEMDLARSAFRLALEIQPSMELSPITTSPRILSVFMEVQKQVLFEAP